MAFISNVPVNHGRFIASGAYLKVQPEDKVIFDDISYPHSQLGKHKLAKKARYNVKPYERKISILEGYTWMQILNGSLSKDFRRVDYKPKSVKFHTSIPESFLIYKNLDHKDIDKIGAFDYTKGLRFGGILDENGIFYIFWIDQNLSDIYDHTN